MRLAKRLPSDRAEQILSRGLSDEVYRCREAAVDALVCLPTDRRKELLEAFLKREPYLRLRDTAQWLLRNPEARTALP